MSPFGGSNAPSRLARAKDAANQAGHASPRPYTIPANCSSRSTRSPWASSRAGAPRRCPHARVRPPSTRRRFRERLAHLQYAGRVECFRCARHRGALASGQGARRRCCSGTSRRHEHRARDDAHSSRCDHAVAITVEQRLGKHRRRLFSGLARGCRGCERRRRSGRFSRYGHGRRRWRSPARSLVHAGPGASTGQNGGGITFGADDGSGPTTSGGGPLPGSTPDPVTGNGSGVTENASEPFSVSVLDNQAGVVLYPGVDQFATLNGWMDLDGAGSGATASSYCWTTTGFRPPPFRGPAPISSTSGGIAPTRPDLVTRLR